ncbi:MAG: ADP-ribosylation factor-like protein [Candidatus Hodarchaeales archaeon]
MLSSLAEKILSDNIKVDQFTDYKKLEITSLKHLNEDQVKKLVSNNIKTLEDLSNRWVDVTKLAKECEIKLSLLEKISASCRILIRGKDVDVSDEVKIILAGLDNSGKSSIISLLKRKKPLLEIHKEINNLTPTTGLLREEIDLSGLTIRLWELGGQEQYRSQYLKEPEMYFLDSHTLIFVLDIQNQKRFEESLDYMKSLIGLLKFLEIPFPIQIFLHKADPNVELSSYKNQLNDNIKSIIKETGWNVPEDIFLTSIFDPASITAAFTMILSRLVPIKTWIEESLVNIAIANKSPFCSLLNCDTLVFLGLYSAFKPEHTNQLKQLVLTNLHKINPTEEFFLILEQKDFDKNPVYIGFTDVTINNRKFIYSAVYTNKHDAITNLDRVKLSPILQEDIGKEIEFLRISMASVPRMLA